LEALGTDKTAGGQVQAQKLRWVLERRIWLGSMSDDDDAKKKRRQDRHRTLERIRRDKTQSLLKDIQVVVPLFENRYLPLLD